VPFLSSASPAQIQEILDATHALWGEGLDRAGYERYNEAQRRTAWGARHLHRLVLTDGRRWLSTAKRYELRARLDGRETSVLGIGAVFTPEPLRRQGFAADLIRRMLEQAEGEGFGLALLFSEIGVSYYRSLGFQAAPITQLRLAAAPLLGPAAIPMRSGEARDAAAIAEMNVQQAEGFRFTVLRDVEYVAHAIAKKRLLAASGPPARRNVEFFVVEEGGRAAGYLVLLEVGEFWMITECGDRDPSGARVGAILQTLLADPERRPTHIRAWLPPNFLPPQVRVVARETPALTMMLRPVGRGARLESPLGERDIAYWHADAF
jgi:GNAT superfamily N-acetyltransferase